MGIAADVRVIARGGQWVQHVQVAEQRHARPDGWASVAQAQVVGGAEAAARIDAPELRVVLNALRLVAGWVLALALLEKCALP